MLGRLEVGMLGCWDVGTFGTLEGEGQAVTFIIITIMIITFIMIINITIMKVTILSAGL